MLAYLERYAEKFDLARRIRLGTRVDLLDRVGAAPLADQVDLQRRRGIASRSVASSSPPVGT